MQCLTGEVNYKFILKMGCKWWTSPHRIGTEILCLYKYKKKAVSTGCFNKRNKIVIPKISQFLNNIYSSQCIIGKYFLKYKITLKISKLSFNRILKFTCLFYPLHICYYDANDNSYHQLIKDLRVKNSILIWLS